MDEKSCHECLVTATSIQAQANTREKMERRELELKLEKQLDEVKNQKQTAENTMKTIENEVQKNEKESRDLITTARKVIFEISRLSITLEMENTSITSSERYKSLFDDLQKWMSETAFTLHEVIDPEITKQLVLATILKNTALNVTEVFRKKLEEQLEEVQLMLGTTPSPTEMIRSDIEKQLKEIRRLRQKEPDRDSTICSELDKQLRDVPQKLQKTAAAPIAINCDDRVEQLQEEQLEVEQEPHETESVADKIICSDYKKQLEEAQRLQEMASAASEMTCSELEKLLEETISKLQEMADITIKVVCSEIKKQLGELTQKMLEVAVNTSKLFSLTGAPIRMPRDILELLGMQ